MAYGLEFTNNDNVVTLDSEYARLVVVSKGRFIPTQESGLGSTTNFERVVTTQESPLVFVRPDTVNAVAGLCQMRVLGSPGNWTGFYVRAYNSLTAQPRGSYFAAAFQASPVADYGLRMFDETGKIIFDSGTPCAAFTKSYQTWAYVKYDYDSQGLTRCYFSVPFDFSAGDYMLINNFGMDMAGASFREAALYCWWDFPGNRLWAITIGVTNQTTIYLPAVFARMQV
jgi:hypothetical protein